MLYLPPGSGMPQRVHGAFVADARSAPVVEYLKTQGEPQYIDGILDEPEDGATAEPPATALSQEKPIPLYDQAVRDRAPEHARPSISLVQRHLRIGYNRAARLIEDMEKAGWSRPCNPTATARSSSRRGKSSHAAISRLEAGRWASGFSLECRDGNCFSRSLA